MYFVPKNKALQSLHNKIENNYSVDSLPVDSFQSPSLRTQFSGHSPAMLTNIDHAIQQDLYSASGLDSIVPDLGQCLNINNDKQQDVNIAFRSDSIVDNIGCDSTLLTNIDSFPDITKHISSDLITCNNHCSNILLNSGTAQIFCDSQLFVEHLQKLSACDLIGSDSLLNDNGVETTDLVDAEHDTLGHKEQDTRSSLTSSLLTTSDGGVDNILFTPVCENDFCENDFCENVSVDKYVHVVPKIAHGHVPVIARMTQCVDNWVLLLQNDFDAEYLLEGITHGFRIISAEVMPPSTLSRNYKSATLINKCASEKQILTEIELDRYIVSETIPHVVSSIGAIPKSDGSVRLIHDLSRPHGGVNILTDDTSVRFPTLEDAIKMIKPGSFLAKVDLKSAYRHVPIHQECFTYMGLQWNFGSDSEVTYLYDCRLPFGASRSCRVFQSITTSMVRMLSRAGYNCTAYIDNFFNCRR